MPQIKPITVETSTGNFSFNPIGRNGERVNYVSDENTPLLERQTLVIRVRNASLANTGHLTELQLASPIVEELPDGCCPTTVTQYPANTFNLRILRAKASNDTGIDTVIEELRSLLDDPDIVSIIKGSGLY